MVPYQTAPSPARPSTGLKVLGIVQIAFGALGLIGAPINVLVAVLGSASKDPVQRKLHAALWEGPVAGWSYTQAALGLVLASLLLAGGIGIVRGRRWGRTASLAYAIGTLVSIVLVQLIMAMAVYPMLLDAMDSPSPVSRAAAIGGLAGGLGAALFGCVLPLVVLIVLLRRSAREQLVE